MQTQLGSPPGTDLRVRSFHDELRSFAAHVAVFMRERAASPDYFEKRAQLVIDAAGPALGSEELVKSFRRAWTEITGRAPTTQCMDHHAYTLALGVLLERYFATRDAQNTPPRI
ncbi:MAG: hypothetical protein JWM95_2377 [Gemmatimonadetes bacterium]|nr:hypothetical protein [Gemmatimonadota bacterium]